MDNELLEEKVAEGFKLLIHLGILSLGVSCDLYAVGAFMVRPKKHLAFNIIGYTLLTVWEGIQIRRHWRSM